MVLKLGSRAVYLHMSSNGGTRTDPRPSYIWQHTFFLLTLKSVWNVDARHSNLAARLCIHRSAMSAKRLPGLVL
jgi:hypothetical protein